MATVKAQMKTDAYTECRGVGHIGRNGSRSARHGQYLLTAAGRVAWAMEAQGILP